MPSKYLALVSPSYTNSQIYSHFNEEEKCQRNTSFVMSQFCWCSETNCAGWITLYFGKSHLIRPARWSYYGVLWSERHCYVLKRHLEVAKIISLVLFLIDKEMWSVEIVQNVLGLRLKCDYCILCKTTDNLIMTNSRTSTSIIVIVNWLWTAVYGLVI